MKRLAMVGFVLLVTAAIAMAGLLHWIDGRLDERRMLPTAVVDVEIEPGMSAAAAGRRFEEAGVIRAGRDLVWWLRWNELGGQIHVGEYRIDAPVSIRELAEIITAGRVRLYPITVPEGSTRWQVAEAIAGAGFGDADRALAATAEVALIADLDPAAESLEGYLYPETYMVPRGTTAEEVVRLMVEAFRVRWTPARAQAAAELEMTLRDVVTLASIIEAETPSGAEREVVSGVFHNRLARGMLLQTDPTVLYARWLAGKDGRTIYRSDLDRDSPYNTYLYPGLPAGPIGNPREASIAAALEPADVEYLYFVSRNDGTHAFSTTLEQHNRYVNEYQR